MNENEIEGIISSWNVLAADESRPYKATDGTLGFMLMKEVKLERQCLMILWRVGSKIWAFFDVEEKYSGSRWWYGLPQCCDILINQWLV